MTEQPSVKHGCDLSAAIVIGAITLCFFLVGVAHCQPTCSQLAQVTLSGKLAGANGLPAKNYVMTLKPSQQGYIAGCNVNLAINTTCATSTDGSVVGIPNPLTATVNTTSGAGSLGPGTYYTVYEWYDAAGNVTLAGPETVKILSATGSLVINPPSSGIPTLAIGMDVFIGTTSGGETLQGQTTGSASFVQSAALISGATPASSNTTLCQVTANDTIWPTGTGYNVSLVDSVGNPIPQYPMQWQLLGPGTTINLSNGLPYYHGTVFYPVPILANPANHGTQSISGTLDLGGYFLRNVARIGVGTSTPAWGVDVEGTGLNGLINSKGGYLNNGAGGTAGQCLASDGTAFNTSVACLTSVGSLYYQTLQVGGVSKPQQSKLNLIPGANTTVACADNTGSGSTDCTIGSTSANAGISTWSTTAFILVGGPTTYYLPAMGNWPPSAAEDYTSQTAAPVSATISDLQISLDPPQPAWSTSTGTLVFTFRDNGSSTAVTCTITAPAITCSDLVHTASVAQGDLIDFKLLATGTWATDNVVNLMISYHY